MNVVIYARFSSHSQNEQSIEGQLKTCYDYAEKNNYTIINEYIDRALTGTNDNRPQFQKMIEDSNKKQFQGVLVYQLDRFARNRYDSAIYKSKLKKNGVRVLSARENISDDASGILVEGLLESMAEYYSAELSQKVVRGMNINAEKGLSNGGAIPLGYKVINKKYVIDDAAAPIIKQIFEMYSNGKTVIEITDYLNANGIKSSRGSQFNKNSLHTILKNKKYIGYYKYNGIEIQDGIPRIIEDELFYKVQDIINKNKKAPARARAKEEYLLTTKLFCGHCKSLMVGISGISANGKTFCYYSCNKSRKKLCSKKNVQKEYIENLVIEECRKLFTNENINKIAHEVVKICEQDNNNAEIKRLEKLIKNNERKQNNLASALVECDIESARKALFEQIPILDNEKKELEKALALETMKQVNITEPQIKFFLTELKKGNADNIRYKKTLINIFVNSIYLYDDKLTIVFNSGDIPVTIDNKLLDKIEQNSKLENCSYKEQNGSPLKHFRIVAILKVTFQ